MITTPGQIIVNEALPEKYRDYTRVMGKDETDAVLARIATDDPGKYREVSHALMQTGRHGAFDEGMTLRLRDLSSPIDRKPYMDMINKKEDEIDDDPETTTAEKNELKAMLFSSIAETMTDETYKASLALDNPFALQVKSKARGSKGQLGSLISSPGTYSDHNGNMIPVFIRRSFAEGLKPEEYWAAAYGGRLGVLSTKTGTAKGGYLGKLMSAAAKEVVITDRDCGTSNGVPVKADDLDNIGSVLARQAGPFQPGTIITNQVLATLKKKGIEDIATRSPLTCSCARGVCQQCTGQREPGKFPPIGYHLGENASSALAEPVAQQALNQKHSGKKSANAGFTGFDVIKNLATAPSTYPDRAGIAELDGVVESVTPAPQGGTNITIGGQVHYALPDMDVYVKPGDTVSAGDPLSNGIVNPADVVRLKGLGEGRKYFADRFTQAFRESGLGVNRRNVEAVSRAIVNHVQIDDEEAEGDSLPGETVTYGHWSQQYKPRPDSAYNPPSRVIGQHLEEPYLHYSIGTKITKPVADTLTKFGYDNIRTHTKPVGVTPKFISLIRTPEYVDDWMARLGSSYLDSRLLKDVQSGATSDTHGLHPLPGLAKATEFGQPPKGSIGPY
jgi:DNA-directed RNA polymerase subunit beta'